MADSPETKPVDTAEEKKPQNAFQRITYTNELEAPTIYTNRVEMFLGQNEIRFRLCEILKATEEEAIARILIMAYLTPQHVKKVHEMIGRQLNRYEEKFGPIPD